MKMLIEATDSVVNIYGVSFKQAHGLTVVSGGFKASG